MKLAPLLAQFLYSNKRLDLPGIGTFLLNGPVHDEPDNKQNKSIKPDDISFENNQSLKETPDLVQYISSQTGKIKALAAADLDSHLSLVQQFLNIGKPFLLEGIGSLVKIKSGEYAFSSGDILSEKLKDYTAKEISATSSVEESFSDYKKPINTGNSKNWRKPAVLLLIIAGIGLAVWGGYTVYKVTTSKNKTTKISDPVSKDETILVPDTATQKKDSTPVIAQTPAGNYRFVFEIAKAKRAFSRQETLKKYGWNIQLETNDSVNYKLFMLVPASLADTSHLVDSFTRFNGKRVYIE